MNGGQDDIREVTIDVSDSYVPPFTKQFVKVVVFLDGVYLVATRPCKEFSLRLQQLESRAVERQLNSNSRILQLSAGDELLLDCASQCGCKR